DKIEPPASTFIYLVDPNACGECPARSCLKICPTHVFEWDEEVGMLVFFGRCLECGACSMACPPGNIDFDYPPGGYGVTYRFG
ncbi:MAG: ferredoxin family protein, partial [Syntrophothermus sp.]